jgi:hypothetical protein
MAFKSPITRPLPAGSPALFDHSRSLLIDRVTRMDFASDDVFEKG